MTYTYDTATGKETIEISDEWAELLVKLDNSEQWNIRKPHVRGRKIVKQVLSLEAMDFEGLALSCDGGIGAAMEAEDTLAGLTDREKEVVVCLYHVGFSAPETAEQMGVSRGRVYQLRESAFNKIREEL